MSAKAKNILSYWRIPAYFLVLSIIFIIVALNSEKLEGAFSALTIFVAVPGLIISFFWAIYKCIKSAIEYRNTGWPEYVTMPEVELFRNIGEWISDEFDTVSDLSFGMKMRYILFRVFGIVLIVGGIVLAFILPVIGALVIIGGATLSIMANPDTYDARVEGVNMIPCSKGDDVQMIYENMKGMWTPLGTPYLAKVRGVKGDALVWGPDDDSEMIVVYHARLSPCFYASKLFLSSYVTEQITEPEAATERLLDENELFDIDTLLMKIAIHIEVNVLE